MSSTRKKITYQCDQECQMGGCPGKRCVILYHAYHSVDIYHIVHVVHADDAVPQIDRGMSGSHNFIDALTKLLTSKDDELPYWDAQDFDFYKYAMTPEHARQPWTYKIEENAESTIRRLP